MPVLKNPRHEAFAQARAAGKGYEEAYASAGFKPHPGNAYRLSKKEEVLRRIAEIQTRVAEKVKVTVETLAQELEDARLLAIKKEQTAAAVAATMGKAKLLGLDVNKSVNVNLNSNFHEQTDEELQSALASMLNEVRALAGKPVVELPASAGRKH